MGQPVEDSVNGSLYFRAADGSHIESGEDNAMFALESGELPHTTEHAGEKTHGLIVFDAATVKGGA
jgi:hypothetical protein